jgi:hypothetical protein
VIVLFKISIFSFLLFLSSKCLRGFITKVLNGWCRPILCNDMLGVLRLCSRKPFSVLVTTTPPICNALAAKKSDVSLNPRIHGTLGEVSVMLPVLLAVENCCQECFNIEIVRNRGQIFVIDRGFDNFARSAVVGFLVLRYLLC